MALDLPPEPRRVAIYGATSSLALATARRFAAEGAHLHLVARDAERLAAIAADLRLRGAAGVTSQVLDFADPAAPAAAARASFPERNGPDIALIAFGVLGSVTDDEADPAAAARRFSLNATATVQLALELANLLEIRGCGTLGILSSVAGDRGRRANYPYGAAKAAVSACAEGLRARLAPAGIAVVTLKPGPIDTPMTAHLPRSPLFSSPEAAGRAIHRALLRGSKVAYIPAWWGPIMALLRLLPEALFRRVPG